ncbi:MAG: hypothetical protein M3238_03485 [Actinomycetota bacterium]|nr:hypothetical protein [Actinomycetota bacterium]
MEMKRATKALLAGAAVTGLIAGAIATPAVAGRSQAPLKGEGKNMKIIANVGYKSGSDMEFATIKGRTYAFAGSFAPTTDGGGLHVIDVTNPEKVKEVAWLKCSVYQNDIQISHDNKTVIMAADSAGAPDSCLMVGKKGFMTIDISNPAKPRPIGIAEIPRGSHNTTAHPTKPFVYNSDSDVGNVRGEIQIWSIKDPAKPKLVNTVPAVGHSPHDISFNSKGTQAVTAGVDNIELYDTSDPANPTLQATFQCPGCSITHDAKFTPDDKGLIVGDEGGGGLPYPCPGGALYFYQLQGGVAPVLTGIYEPDEVLMARDSQGGLGSCTSHVFDISPDGKTLAISWYTAGTRLLDISAMQGASFGDAGNTGGIKEIGYFMPDGGVSWSSKFANGTKYVFSNDTQRGFDVFRVTGK